MAIPSLQELQRLMKARIRPAGGADTSSLAAHLNPQGGAPGIERLDVYAGGYVARIAEALAETYEAVRHVLGPQAFTALAEEYARRYPSRSHNLSMAGAQLAEHLGAHRLSAELPFLPDLARLEWAVAQAFHAFDRPPVGLSTLARLRPELWPSLQLVFQPSVAVVSSAWPVLDIWAARTTPRGSINIELIDRPQHVLVFRAGTQIRCDRLEPPAAALLCTLRRGDTLGQACDALASHGTELAASIQQWFARWAALGLVTDWRVQSS